MNKEYKAILDELSEKIENMRIIMCEDGTCLNTDKALEAFIENGDTQHVTEAPLVHPREDTILRNGADVVFHYDKLNKIYLGPSFEPDDEFAVLNAKDKTIVTNYGALDTDVSSAFLSKEDTIKRINDAFSDIDDRSYSKLAAWEIAHLEQFKEDICSHIKDGTYNEKTVSLAGKDAREEPSLKDKIAFSMAGTAEKVVKKVKPKHLEERDGI